MTAEQLPYVTTLTAYFGAGTSGRTILVMSTGFEGFGVQSLDESYRSWMMYLPLWIRRARVTS